MVDAQYNLELNVQTQLDLAYVDHVHLDLMGMELDVIIADSVLQTMEDVTHLLHALKVLVLENVDALIIIMETGMVRMDARLQLELLVVATLASMACAFHQEILLQTYFHATVTLAMLARYVTKE